MSDHFVIVNPNDCYVDDMAAVDWKMLPEELFNIVPEYYMRNTIGVDKEGNLGYRTVVYMYRLEPGDTEDPSVYDDEYVGDDGTIFSIHV